MIFRRPKKNKNSYPVKKIWKERKKELKEMSKRELAEEMFGAGVYIAINNFIDVMKKESEKDVDNEDEKSNN